MFKQNNYIFAYNFFIDIKIVNKLLKIIISLN